jgi:hypothetical protein
MSALGSDFTQESGLEWPFYTHLYPVTFLKQKDKRGSSNKMFCCSLRRNKGEAGWGDLRGPLDESLLCY